MKAIYDLIKSDADMIYILEVVESLNLNDSWVSAGFIRNKIWDTIHGYTDKTPYNDVDVIFYNADCLDESIEKRYEEQLRDIDSSIPWSVKNQARMHLKNDFNQYIDSKDAVDHYPEAPTAICARIKNGKLEVHYNYSVLDLFNGIVSPTQYFNLESGRYDVYLDRINRKQWHKQWPNLTFDN
ncbi:nucleotidyltransferase family protein [Mammaliicoccus sciuri]|uniref:nucleotidyltransferase family protein n=1 Tax=Mammaliicoccus sciuri TaxID=1296 RepID=UPI0018CBB106|nr:nucleotidyltransferase family protein [Mammaliicoccus sciuri]MBG9211266.1 nucleotidyltransferase family protein [Mammaliicoccus sciuri]MDT0755442.1 nucleotidyltransferase family protein [Mammaliicoccus sciuri]WQL33178.1 nucleotidyltransferase family protein [Mammaliicoccus sciuri]WQL60116.1 nucleotidyltransferase family protein [Mammaliicoccus sciuri]